MCACVNAQPPALKATVEADADFYDSVDDGVVVISGLYLCGKCDKLHTSNASGFVISEDGLAVTNYHVLDGKKHLTMVAMTRDGRVHPIVEVLAANKAADAALVRLAGKDFKPVSIARSAKVGETVHTVSHPSGRFYQFSRGVIARFFVDTRRGRANEKRISVTSDYAGGSSGGPIFNDKGQVVGMVAFADAKTDQKIVYYDSVPYESILKLFKLDDDGKPRESTATVVRQNDAKAAATEE